MSKFEKGLELQGKKDEITPKKQVKRDSGESPPYTPGPAVRIDEELTPGKAREVAKVAQAEEDADYAPPAAKRARKEGEGGRRKKNRTRRRSHKRRSTRRHAKKKH